MEVWRDMRRAKQQIPEEECRDILKRATSGVLGVIGDNGYPYTVPLSFAYLEDGDGCHGRIVFHGAKTGHKVEAVRQNTTVSFTVIDRDEIMPKELTTKFSSVIAFGRARILSTDEELRQAANAVGAKYSAGFEDLYLQETEDAIRQQCLCCIEITIEHMTGKIGKEVLKERL